MTPTSPVTLSRGPYMNEDGDWWVAVEDASFREARRAVIDCLHYSVPEEGRLAYLGKSMANLSEGNDFGEQTERVRYTLAYHFEERGQR